MFTLHVLIIDDSEDIVNVFTRMLNSFPRIGSVFSCPSLNHAYEIIRSKTINIIILDLNLADSKGTDTLVAFRKLFPYIPVVVVTGQDEPELFKKCFDAGADDYLTKSQITPLLLFKSCAYAAERSERVKLSRRQELIIGALKLLNQPSATVKMIEDLLGLIQDFTKIEALAIRLHDNGDYPYFVYRGFDKRFIELENSLCHKQDGRAVLTDSGEHILLNCMCGCVINGNTNSTYPFFTEGGSFWTNSTTKLLENYKLPIRSRNVCNIEGYESVAIIPLSTGSEIIGTIQLNDRREDLFDIQSILFMEELALAIAVAVKRAWQDGRIRILEVAKTRDLLESSRLLNAGIAHELRTPMQAIRNCLELIQSELTIPSPTYYCEKRTGECPLKTNSCDSIKDILDLADDGLESLHYTVKVLDSLSEYSKIASSNEIHLINVVPELKTIMKALMLTDQFKCFNKNSFTLKDNLSKHYKCHIPIVRADFTQLVSNLCRNAIEAIDHDDPKIDISVSSHDPYVKIVITDNGKGIDNKLGNKIFEPYFSTKENPEGYNQGLGLAMVRDIVGAYSGNISYQSRPGHTQFIIELPCERTN